MKKNARRKHGGYKYDRAGRIIDGLIDNGRLVLMISLCLSFGFMIKQLSNLEPMAKAQPPKPEITLVYGDSNPNDPAAAESVSRNRERSEYRVKMFALCAEKSYREQNAVTCEELNEDVDDILEKHNENSIRDKSGPTDGGTYLDTDSQPIVVAIRST